MMKTFNNVIFKMAQYKATLSTEKVKGSNDFFILENIFDYFSESK